MPSRMLKVRWQRQIEPAVRAASRLNTENPFTTPRTSLESWSARDRALLGKVTVVEEVEQSRGVVEALMELREPVALDMEGINSGVTGLIQVRDTRGNITFFRTARNPELYTKGRLAELLESPDILKIMHGSTTDCMSVYKDGVKLWGLWDTQVAHKVLQFQQHGSSLTHSNEDIGLNSLCQHFKLEQNPLKSVIKFHTEDKTGHENAKTMTDQFLLYAAWDVEQLHQLHALLSAQIAPDYLALMHQLTEVKIIHCLDPTLAKLKKNSLRGLDLCGIFLSRLPGHVTKPDLYSAAALLDGHKHIYHSALHSTAHLILESRVAAVAALPLMQERMLQLGRGVKVKLLEAPDPREGRNYQPVRETATPPTGEVPQPDGVSEPGTCREVMAAVVQARVPVVIEFTPHGEDTLVELYTGAGPVLKMPLDSAMVEAGFGQVMASPEVVKVFFRVDVSNVSKGLRSLGRLGVRVEGVYDLDAAAKLLDYLDCGQSIFTSPSKKIRKLISRYRIPADTAGPTTCRMEWYYLAYGHLVASLPPGVAALLQEKTRIEVAIGSYIEVALHKEQRADLKQRLDVRTLHLRLDGLTVGKREQERLRKLVEDNCRSVVDYTSFGRCSLVQFESRAKTRHAFKTLTTVAAQSGGLGVVVAWPDSLGVVERPDTRPASMDRLASWREGNLARLGEQGLVQGRARTEV